MYNDIYLKEQYAYSYHTFTKWLYLRNSGRSTIDFFIKYNLSKIAIYGIAGHGDILFTELRNSSIKTIFFIDKKYKEFSKGYNGIPVLGIDSLKERLDEIDAIIVAPVYYFNRIFESLIKYDIPQNKIISLSMVVAE